MRMAYIINEGGEIMDCINIIEMLEDLRKDICEIITKTCEIQKKKGKQIDSNTIDNIIDQIDDNIDLYIDGLLNK